MIRTLLIIGLVVFVSGCVSMVGAPTNRYAPEWQPMVAGSDIHLFPVVRTFSFDRSEVPIVEEMLIQELMSLGHNVVNREHRFEEDNMTFSAVSDRLIYSTAYYEKNIQSNPSAEYYIFPTIVAREATFDGKTAKWDGVSHEFKVVGGSGLGMWSGAEEAYSLQLEVFDQDGKWLMTTFGGISLPIYAHAPSRELRRKEHLFGDKSDFRRLVRGVNKAIAPLKITQLKEK